MYFNDAFVRPRYEETDQMGVVYHGNYLTYFEVGRSEFFRSLGYSYRELEQEGIVFPVINASCSYLIPAKYDDELYIRTRVVQLKGARIKLTYEVIRKEENKEVILVTGTTEHAFVNKDLKPIRLRNENIRMWNLLEKCIKGEND